jgi:hypothetical protein
MATTCLHAQSGGGATSAGANVAAGTAKAPNPAFLNQIYYYWADTLLACPKSEGRMESKMKALGFGGSQMGYTMDGGRSGLRIKAGDSLRFVIRAMGDPSSMIQLYRFEAKKDSRQAVMSSQSRFGGNKDSKAQVSFDVQRSGTEVFILIPSARLAPGEYGFMNQAAMNRSGMTSMSFTFYTFGVD